MVTETKRLAFFVSGSGTNMENLVKGIHAGRIQALAALVLSDKQEAGAVSKADRLGVPVAIVNRRIYATKKDFEEAIAGHLEQRKIDLIILAGFMKILSPEFVRKYWGKIINIHPSLLPAFPGAHGIRDAFNAKVPETGVTVHFVDTGVDSGPIILQRKVPITPEDTLETLEAKIHAVEYEVFPEALRMVLSGKATPPPPPAA